MRVGVTATISEAPSAEVARAHGALEGKAAVKVDERMSAKGGRAGGLTAAGAGGGGRAARAGKGAGAAGSVDSEHVQHIMGVSDQLALPHLLDHSKVVLLCREPKAPARSTL